MSVTGRILASLFAAFTAAACSTVDVTTDFDRAAAFGRYETYSLAPAPDEQKLPLYCEIALRKVIRSELAARGLKEMEGPDADVAIVWHAFLSGRTSPRETAEQRADGQWDHLYGAYTYWYGMPANLANTSVYPDGTLLLDVVDMRTKKLVFRGTGTAVAMGPERCASNIEKAVPKMIGELPAKP